MAKMTWVQVRERIECGEDEHTEFKRWEGFPKKVAEALCAFANSDGGLVILGVDDSGEITGQAGEEKRKSRKRTSSWSLPLAPVV